MMKSSVKWEDITILNTYVPSNTASKYMTPKELKGGIDKSINIVWSFDIPLSVIYRKI